MYKIAICDDDKNYREKIEKVIETEGILPKSEIRFYEYESGKELLKNADILHDLVFMDMRMPGLDGNKSVLKLREYNRAAILVFCSGYFEPTSDSINIGQPFRYIMKDLHDRSLKREIPAILSKVKLHCGDSSVTVTSAGRVIRIYTEDILYPLHLYHRIELTFSTGRLCLVNTHGPVIWLPFLHMPRDEYGTLSINVEEEVNIPSGVTIGNVMLPSVKETFEQIWPDAVKKALEILFKQNRTEKMSMAQYQIYVSKLWSEICQKVGYMNIVDYDNFGDIKSIFYDLEKRHLIKKENDGIE